jgi:hypothetical protein
VAVRFPWAARGRECEGGRACGCAFPVGSERVNVRERVPVAVRFPWAARGRECEGASARGCAFPVGSERA